MLNKKECQYCGKEFETNSKLKVYCCDECRNINGRKRNIDKVKSERFKIFKRDNFACVYCGRNSFEDKVKLHVDHLIPRAKGGSNKINNLVTSCQSCNNCKKDKLLSKEIIEKIKNRKIMIHESTERGNRDNGEAL